MKRIALIALLGIVALGLMSCSSSPSYVAVAGPYYVPAVPAYHTAYYYYPAYYYAAPAYYAPAWPY
jgi:hypothetical protein